MAADLVFLVLIVGVPVAVIALLIRTVVKKSFVSVVFKNLADSNGWNYFKSGKDHSLDNILDDSVFTERGGIHKLSNIIDTGSGLYFCDCRCTGRVMPGHRRGNDYAVAVVGRVKSSPVFRILRHYRNAVENIVEPLAEEQFKQVDGESWNWLLTSSVDAFNQAGWSGVQAEALEAVMEPGSLLFLTESRIILFLPGFLYTRKIADLKVNMEKLQQLL